MEANEVKDKKSDTDNVNEVIVKISDDNDAEDRTNDDSDVLAASSLMGIEALRINEIQRNSFANYPSPGISSRSPGFSPGVSPNKPPKIPAQRLTRLTSITNSAFPALKPKSRFVEPPVPLATNPIEEKTKSSVSPFKNPSSPYMTSPSNIRQMSPNNNNKIKVSVGTTPTRDTSRKESLITPKTPLIGSPAVEEEEEDEEIYTTENVSKTKKNSGKKMKIFVIIEVIAFICIMAWLATSLTINSLRDLKLWSLEMWKWCVLVMVIFCGRLFSMWLINILVFLIERNFLLRKKVLYFVYALKKSTQACIWLGLVLLAWALLINRGVTRSKQAEDNLNYVTRGLIASLVSAAVFLTKTLCVKLLASSFHVTTFFDRIQESIFHQYVLQTLSGRPIMELAEKFGAATSSAQLSFRSARKGKEELVDISKLHKLKQGKVSAWTMKGLVNMITTTGLTTLSHTIEDINDEEGEQVDKEITCEFEAKAAAYQIFKNVAKPGSKFIEEEDLLRFLSKDEVAVVLPLFAGTAETGKIKKSSLRTWVVNVYIERKSLAYSLDDTKTAIKQLNKLTTSVIVVLIVILWLLLMGLATTEVLLYISSQMLLVVFMFGNTAKVVFEAIVFVFVLHPFDVGDRCVIDGVQMIVEEMNILTTVFLRYDNEKMYYPNAVLGTKCISNFYRSPFMGDGVDFSIDVSTTIETIGEMKARLKAYIESKPQHWNPNHSVVLKEIVEVNKMNMALYMTHTMNHQNMGEKTNRRSDLVWELKKIFEDLDIKYHLLPQEVQLNTLSAPTPRTGRRT